MPCLVTEASAIVLTSGKSNFNLCEIFINFVEHNYLQTHYAKQNMIKFATTIDQQLDLLEQRGLRINDREKAKEILLDIGYYRLGFYFIAVR